MTAAIELLAVTARTVTFAVFSARNSYFLNGALGWRLLAGASGETVAEGVTDKTVLSVCGLAPETGYRFEIGGETLSVTTRPESLYAEISDFGASPDSENNAVAIQSAIDAMPAGATLHVGPGVWKSGPLFLKSGLTLLLDRDAVLYGIADRAQYPILPARRDDGRVLGTWEGVAEACYASLITAIDATDIAIVGEGRIDAAATVATGGRGTRKPAMARAGRAACSSAIAAMSP